MIVTDVHLVKCMRSYYYYYYYYLYLLYIRYSLVCPQTNHVPRG